MHSRIESHMSLHITAPRGCRAPQLSLSRLSPQSVSSSHSPLPLRCVTSLQWGVVLVTVDRDGRRLPGVPLPGRPSPTIARCLLRLPRLSQPRSGMHGGGGGRAGLARAGRCRTAHEHAIDSQFPALTRLSAPEWTARCAAGLSMECPPAANTPNGPERPRTTENGQRRVSVQWSLYRAADPPTKQRRPADPPAKQEGRTGQRR